MAPRSRPDLDRPAFLDHLPFLTYCVIDTGNAATHPFDEAMKPIPAPPLFLSEHNKAFLRTFGHRGCGRLAQAGRARGSVRIPARVPTANRRKHWSLLPLLCWRAPNRLPSFFLVTTMTTRILFYSVADDYGEFSNFAPFPVRLRGQTWPTSEHFFQAQKFTDPSVQRRIRKAKSPALAARLGRDRRLKLRRDWESVRVAIMREAVEAKFRQHPELKALLLSTGDSELVEHTQRDAYWGDGGDGSGRNMLGRILMDLRQVLKQDSR